MPTGWRALLAEFTGTFALVFFGCGAIANGLPPTSVALSFGLAIAVMVYAFGHISGAHFNPAVSIGFGVIGHIGWATVARYAAVQTAGAVVAAVVLVATLGSSVSLGVTQPSSNDVQAFAWEVVLTFFLMLVISAVATDDRAVGEAAALAIGGTVGLGSLVGGPISGASMNPARSIGPAIVSGDLTALWIYLTAPVVGAAIAAVLYRRLREGPRAEPTG